MSESDDEVYFKDSVAHVDEGEDVATPPAPSHGAIPKIHRPGNGVNNVAATSNDGQNDTTNLLRALLHSSSRPKYPLKDFPSFDGSQNWDDFYQQVLRIKLINKWGDDEAAMSLSLSLKGAALQLLNAIQKARGGSPLGWHELIELLKSSFCPVDNTDLLS